MRLFLIDGNSYVYRAFHAVKDLSTSTGFPTNAIFGFTNMLFKFLREIKPDAIAIVFDSAGPTKRHKIYSEYKAQRPETPNALVMQIPYIRKIVKAMNIKSIEVQGAEADDVIAAVARRAVSDNTEVFIVSADKDMLQLVDDRIKIYDPLKDRILDRQAVIKKLGIPPERVPEFMALTGDSIDNIPGVKGIGEKTALELLKKRSLWEYLENPQLIPQKRTRQALISQKDQALLSYELSKLDDSVEVEFSLEEARFREPDWSKLIQIFRQLEFYSLLKFIPPREVPIEIQQITDIQALKQWFSQVKGPLFIRYYDDYAAGLSDGQNYFLVDLNPEGDLFEALKQNDFFKLLAEVMHRGVELVGFDLKGLFRRMLTSGIAFSGRWIDLKVIYWLQNPQRGQDSLQEVALEMLGERFRDQKELLGRDNSFNAVGQDRFREFVAEEVYILTLLKEPLLRSLQEADLADLYDEIEMGIIEVLAEMERWGIKLQKDRFNEALQEVDSQLTEIQERIYSLAGERFNINSPKQLSKILYDKLGLRPKRKTKTGFSTDMATLQELASTHQLPEEVLKYRSLSKIKGTYLEPILKKVDPRTGRLHTTLNQTATATGRLSSSDPNLQNIPIKGPLARKIRDAFVAEDGWVLVSADYSQIELRVLAHLSRDENLIEAFRSGRDIHAETAAKVFGVPEEEVDSEMRRMAKTVNFGIVYGISAFGLSETTGTSIDHAQDFIERYFEAFPGVREFAERMVQEARRLGYVKSLFGRRRPVPELNSPVPHERAFGERVAVNTPVQATAADIMKLAMLKLYRRIKAGSLNARMLLQVHDELLFEVPQDAVQDVTSLIRQAMESVVELSVPLVVEVSWGRTWAEAHG